MTAFAAVSSAQTVCPPGQINQLAKWRFLYKQCYDSALVLKYVPTGEVAYVTAAGELHTISFSALLDSLDVPETDSAVFATRYYVNYLVDSLGALTNIFYPDSSVLFVGSNRKPTTDSTKFRYYNGVLEINKDSNLLIGTNAGRSINTSTPNYANTIIGFNPAPLYNASSSVMAGYRVGSNLTTGGFHTLVGTVVAEGLTTSSFTSALGYHALRLTTTGPNSAFGALCFERGTTISSSTGFGYETGKYINGTGCAFFGHQVAGLTTVVSFVEDATAVGWRSQYSIQANASFNTSVGTFTLRDLTTGISNTAIGRYSGRDITTGSSNVFVGMNTCLSCTTTNNSILIGRQIATTAANSSNEMNIGATIFGTNIYNATARIGILNNAPSFTFDVAGTIRATVLPASTDVRDSVVVGGTAGGQFKKVARNTDTDTTALGNLTIGTVKYYSFAGTTATWTLPTIAASDGATYFIKNRGSGNLTINTAAAGNDIYTTAATNTITVAAGASIQLHNDGTFFVTYP